MPRNTKEIRASIRHEGEVYRSDRDEDIERLEENVDQKTLDKFKARKLIVGTFTSQVEKDDGETTATGAGLPNGFPARMLLVKGGYTITDQVREASDEDLIKLEGVGEATVKDIRKALES